MNTVVTWIKDRNPKQLPAVARKCDTSQNPATAGATGVVGRGGAADPHGRTECSGVNSSRPILGRSRGIKFACDSTARSGTCGQNGEAAGLAPAVLHTACAITLCLLVGVQGHAYLAYPPEEWLLFLGMAVGPGILGHTIINWALKHLESVVVSAGWLGEPVGATLLALALLAEVPDAITIAGGAVVLAGIYVTTIERERRRETGESPSVDD